MNRRPSDPPLPREIAAAAIAARFPRVDVSRLEYLGSGWEFDAYRTADDWVFRFPRHVDAATVFDAEQRVHDLIRGVLPATLVVPRVELIGEPTAGMPLRFAGHRYIGGATVDALDRAMLPRLARDIAAALGAIHSISESDARNAGARQSNAFDGDRTEWIPRVIEMARALRGQDAVVDQAIGWVCGVTVPSLIYVGPARFIHHDLGPEHLLADPASGRLLGILDWTDAALGDPAHDFVFLVTWRGWTFADEVIVHYPPPVDDDFRERLRFMARLYSVLWLALAHEQRTDVRKHIEWVRNAFES